MIEEEAKANEVVAANEDVAANVVVKEEGGAEAAGEAGGESKQHEIVKGGSPDDDNDASTTEEEQEHAPNSKLRVTDPDDTYVYRDFSAIPPPTISEVGSLHPQSLQAQKLPAKLASMLADPGKLYTHAISILRKDSTAMHPQPLSRVQHTHFLVRSQKS
jgi:hypothetical protein